MRMCRRSMPRWTRASWTCPTGICTWCPCLCRTCYRRTLTVEEAWSAGRACIIWDGLNNNNNNNNKKKKTKRLSGARAMCARRVSCCQFHFLFIMYRGTCVFSFHFSAGRSVRTFMPWPTRMLCCVVLLLLLHIILWRKEKKEIKKNEREIIKSETCIQQAMLLPKALISLLGIQCCWPG